MIKKIKLHNGIIIERIQNAAGIQSIEILLGDVKDYIMIVNWQFSLSPKECRRLKNMLNEIIQDNLENIQK